jgi:hypothetical protein
VASRLNITRLFVLREDLLRVRRLRGGLLAPLSLRRVELTLDPLPHRRGAAPVQVPQHLPALIRVQRRELREELIMVHPVRRHGTRS